MRLPTQPDARNSRYDTARRSQRQQRCERDVKLDPTQQLSPRPLLLSQTDRKARQVEECLGNL